MCLFASLTQTDSFVSDQSTGTGHMTDSTQPDQVGHGGVGLSIILGKVTNPAERSLRVEAELANVHLAMMAITGMAFPDGLAGSARSDWPSLFPWDPLGSSADGCEGTFKRSRSVEIKHGRISVHAAMGYIVLGRLTSSKYLSLSSGLNFAELPINHGALPKQAVPRGTQCVSFASLLETNRFVSGQCTGTGHMTDSAQPDQAGHGGVGFSIILGKIITQRSAV